MIKPVSYLQTDSRWKSIDYSANGESTTIGASGCGPTSMAMVIATLKDSSITPVTTCAWSLKKGYKAAEQGTYYSYFVPQGTVYDINVSRINTSNIYGSSNTTATTAHAKALEALNNGHWVIACMGKGNWTSSGHYILAYGVDGDNVLINDPNSTKSARTCASIELWQSQVKYYWIVEVEEAATSEEEEEEVVRYSYLKDIPDTYEFQTIVDKLMTAGIIKGDGSDSDGNDDVIDLSQDMVRMLVFNYNAGVYDEKLETAGISK